MAMKRRGCDLKPSSEFRYCHAVLHIGNVYIGGSVTVSTVCICNIWIFSWKAPICKHEPNPVRVAELGTRSGNFALSIALSFHAVFKPTSGSSSHLAWAHIALRLNGMKGRCIRDSWLFWRGWWKPGQKVVEAECLIWKWLKKRWWYAYIVWRTSHLWMWLHTDLFVSW